MNLVEELRALDPRDPGRWPLPVLAGVVGVTFIIVLLVGFYLLVWNQQRPELQRREGEEQQLRQEFRDKHAKAVNLDVYKQQLKDIERSFGALLRQLPIRLSGSYHQFGEFVSGIAALPRIVTLHDINIKPDNKDAYDQLSLELTAKTYRYLDEEEIAAGEAEKKKDVVHRPGS
jgi:type IV pilus assembly protein PilO